MSDCNVYFKAGKYKVNKCLEKSFLYGDIEPNPFESKDRKEIKTFIINLLIDNIKHERNINNYDELIVFLGIINHIVYLDTIDNPTEMYCEIINM